MKLRGKFNKTKTLEFLKEIISRDSGDFLATNSIFL